MKKAAMKVGDRTWTMTYTINNNKITIIDFNNEDQEGYLMLPGIENLESITESDGRIAEIVRINGEDYEVDNKQNIFTYKLPL